MIRSKATVMLVLGLALGVIAAPAASPPEILNYQGVLRDASDKPLDGSFDMVFRFFSAETLGDEILVDRHLSANGQAVTVSGGLFSVQLGAGEELDGSGPGTYTSLAQVFADYGEVWLEIQVGTETLSPRIRVASSGYALNAGRLGGKTAGQFVDTSGTAQTKAGRLVVNTAGQGSYGIEGYGDTAGALFQDADNSGYAQLGVGNRGINAYGTSMGGFFQDTDNSGEARLAAGNRGVVGLGSVMGGDFSDSDGSGYAYVGIGDRGIEGYGNDMGGYFADLLGTGIARVAFGDRGIQASGIQMGGLFEDSDSSGYAWAAYGDRGIQAGGTEAGGYFEDTDQSGYAYVGYGENGISAYGDTAGGFFQDLNGSGWAYAGTGDYGLRASGDTAGGYFAAGNASGQAWLGEGDQGIRASGTTMGAKFTEEDTNAEAWLAYNGYGVYAIGNGNGNPPAPAGRFVGWDGSGLVELSVPVGGFSIGVDAHGTQYAGQFRSPGVAGRFEDTETGTYTYVAVDSDSVSGNGAKNFVQNHPYDPDLKVVYTALEGPEAATFVRGSGRLSGGVARIALDETFALVTNPDIGLTAQVTPRSPGAVLYVESVTTKELVVRAVEGFDPNAPFDYIVHGLRIGFERIPVIQPKREGEQFPIPSMAAHRALVSERPELRASTPLERFREIAARVEGIDASAIDLSRAQALVAAIHEFDPATDRIEPPRPAPEPVDGRPVVSSEETSAEPPATASQADGPVAVAGAVGSGAGVPAAEQPVAVPGAMTMTVSGPVEAGDLLALDPDRPGALRVADAPLDGGVVGVAAGPAREVVEGGLEVPVVAAGIAWLKVDAGYGTIRPGDLLVSSPTRGHAMRAPEILAGTVIGKALEPLDAGTSTIRVLLMAR